MQTPALKIAHESHMDALLPLVRAYHEFEHFERSDAQRVSALKPLLAPDSSFGRIWLIEVDGTVAGYIALCFGYSIEFGGRDAFIDEFYLVEELRGRGIGGAVLDFIKREATKLGVIALHLEVAGTNNEAHRLYSRHGFQSRQRYHLMSCPLVQGTQSS